MKIIIDSWKNEDGFPLERYVLRYVNNLIAAQIVNIAEGYSCKIYGQNNEGDEKWKNFSSLNAAKEYINNRLRNKGFKILSEEYKVLL